jgi:hypothetical protein
MVKQFKGFTPQQNEVLARRMGYQGDMAEFEGFLSNSPEHSQRYQGFIEKAKSMVGAMGNYAEGGVVQNPLIDGLSNAVPTGIMTQAFQETNQMLNNPQAAITPVKVTPMTVSQNELISYGPSQAQATNDVTATQAQTPQTTQANTVTTDTSTTEVNQATTGMSGVQGTVSQNAQVTAETALPSADATVKGQLDKLMQDFQGGQTPAWAAGAIRNANAIMAARGLGASSMAGGAVTQAAMESALQIAIQDASIYSAFEMKNLDNRQQAKLQNAQAFLQMDLQNLDNEQQMALLRNQSKIQAIFSYTAAENASRQFNATSKNQTEQFFANLKASVSMFNAGQANDVAQFNRQVNEARNQFNAANRLVIDQSNAQWRRSVTTTNNATINEANRINAQTASGMTLAAYNNLMQKDRDIYSYIFDSEQRNLDRAHEIILAKLTGKIQSKAAVGEAIGGLVGAGLSGIIGSWFK